MTPRGSVAAVQVPDKDAGAQARARLAAANVNPTTGLATDYLNHFNEAIMLLELLSSCPDCIADFQAWRPLTYREHFEASALKGRDLVIAAYDEADPTARASLDALAGAMTAVLEAARAAMTADMPPEQTSALAEDAATWLRPLVARAGAVINGGAEAQLPATPQAVVDGLMTR
jgi:hypothetical protein